MTFSFSGLPTNGLPGPPDEPILPPGCRFIFKGESRTTDLQGGNTWGCVTYTWIIHDCRPLPDNYIDDFNVWWTTSLSNAAGWGLFGPESVDCALDQRQDWANNNGLCPDDTNGILVTQGHEAPLQPCASPGRWYPTGVNTCQAGCGCPDPPTDLTGFPASPTDGQTHTAPDYCQLTTRGQTVSVGDLLKQAIAEAT